MDEENLEQPGEESAGEPSRAGQTRQLCQKILSFFPLYSTPLVQAWEEQGKIIVEIQGDKSGILIGKHGQTLLALELVLNRIVQRQAGESIQVCLDCEGYRKRRKEMLERMAREAAEEVEDTGAPVNLGPMPSEERKIIHLVLQEHPRVCTESQGIPPDREIIVKPRPKPEQDEKPSEG